MITFFKKSKARSGKLNNHNINTAELQLKGILKKFRIAAAATGIAHEKDGEIVLIVSLKQREFLNKEKIDLIPTTIGGYKVETKLVGDVSFL